MNFTQKSAVALFGKFLSALFVLVIGIILSRCLGVEGIGQYQLILSTQTLIITILAMGGGNATIYFINSLKVDKVVVATSLLKFYTTISLIVAVVMFLSLVLFNEYFGSLNRTLLIFFTLGSASLLMFNVLTPILYATLEVVKYNILGLIYGIILLIGVTIFCLLDHLNVNTTLLLVGISNIIAFVLFLFSSPSYFNLKLSVDYQLIKKVLVYGIKISAVNLVYILSSNIVIFLLNLLLKDGFEAVGLFSRANSIVSMFILIPSTLGILFYSRWASLEREKLHKEVEKILRIFIFLSIICFFMVIFCGEFLIKILYGEQFVGAKSALNILQLSMTFTSVIVVFVNLFSGLGKPLVLLKIYVVSLIITCVMSLILIPTMNIEGAAISVLVGIIYNAVALFYCSKKEIGLSISKSILIRKQDIEDTWKSLKERR